MSKKLLFITTRLFFKTDSGRKLSLYHYCKGLHEKFGYDIYIYTFLEGDQDFKKEMRNKPSFIKEVYCASEIPFFNKSKNILFKSIFSSKWALQCSLYYSKKNANQIAKICQQIDFDAAITDMIRTAPYIQGLKNVPIKILDMDDLLSKRYEREISTNSDPNFIGQYSKKLSGVSRKLIPFFKNMILKLEIKRLKYCEKYYSEQYDKVIFVSDKETNEMNKILELNKCITITTGVDYKYYSMNIDTKKIPNSISFIGNLEYPPNIDSLRMIVNQVLPYVKKDITLYAIGKVSDSVRAELGNRVVFLGMVDDLRIPVKSTSLFLSPIAYGSGIKTKILEAMAMGLPVLTNSVGAEGINISAGVNAIVSNDMKFLAKEIDRLLDDETECKRLGQAGQMLVKKEYQWEDIWNGFALCGLGD